MSVWQRDYTKRLSKVEFDIFPIELHNPELEFFNDFIDMVDDEGSNHEDEFENKTTNLSKALETICNPLGQVPLPAWRSPSIQEILTLNLG
jgi:hypothetical protein